MTIPPSTDSSGATDSPRQDAVAPEHPLIGLTVEPCDYCPRVVTSDLLWPVIGYGRLCPKCVETLRDEGLNP